MWVRVAEGGEGVTEAEKVGVPENVKVWCGEWESVRVRVAGEPEGVAVPVEVTLGVAESVPLGLSESEKLTVSEERDRDAEFVEEWEADRVGAGVRL